MTITRELEIINEKGLHARASAKFVDLVEKFDADVTVTFGELSVSGDSIMGLLTLAASIGSLIRLEITGNQENELADALEQLVADRFHESF